MFLVVEEKSRTVTVKRFFFLLLLLSLCSGKATHWLKKNHQWQDALLKQMDRLDKL